MNNYDDIINMPHHESKIYPKMSLYNRSAQFAPFAALTGYSDIINETARLTDKKIEIDDGLKSIINNKLLEIIKKIEEEPKVTITYFVKDKYKDGGKYKKVTSKIKKIDKYENEIIFINKYKISISEIIDIKILVNNN